ncbi:hypothetical protein [Luethyella okanaganae]|uniref:DUF3618 domain-containing protein n=1 Tax=Luethyella okanaganae TaxID=69372 RepID=A0ABW1VHT5_9MICO
MTATESNGTRVDASASTPRPRSTRAQLQKDAARVRTELASTLDAIEDKLNLPKQTRLAANRFMARVRGVAERNPVGLVAVAVGTAAVVGAGAWLVVRAVRRG